MKSLPTFASLSIRLQAVSSGAGAEVAALRVFTQEVTGLRRQSALIHIWNMQTGKMRNTGRDAVENICRLTQLLYSVSIKQDR